MSNIYNHLRLIVNPIHPWIYDIKGTDCKGVHCHLLRYVSTSLNFTYNFIEDPIGVGLVLKNGSCTGWLGILQRNVRSYF